MVLLYSFLMLLIILSALWADVLVVGMLAFGLWLGGLFVYRYQNHPVIREWLEKVF
ncbi:hypothetical protein [Sulfuricurvum sp.]|uniref:hypothetical protein n=1 Tax=Sulfuricurvum sp. TaxID=2025608 RepID=UPI00261A9B7E|nr:hypothetical protein [Sulfuricurvum sp.]MDD3597775.1 hypothetical protein [Sulfuricurvum sp.]